MGLKEVIFNLKKMEKNISKVRAHDAIVGMTYLISVAGSMFINTNLIY